MADDAQFDPLAGIMTPGVLAGDRQKLFQNQLSQAGQQDGWGYGARAAGLTLGNALGQMGQGPQDRTAAMNQQLLTQPSEVQASGDSYTDQAAKYDELAKRFLAAGNPQQASKFVQAGQIVRQEGQRYQVESTKAQMEQADMTEKKAGAQWAIVDTTPDKNGIPQYKRIGEPISLFNADGSTNKDFATQRAQAMAEAAKGGAGNLTSMRVDQLENSKAQVASIRANQALAVAAAKAAAQKSDQVGSLDPDDIHTAAVVTLADPTRMHDYVSYGKAGQTKRDAITHEQNQIMHAAGMDPSTLGALRAQAKGDAQAITKLGPQLAQIRANEELAHANGDRILELVDAVNPSNFKSINALSQAVAKGTGGADAAEFASVLATFQSEAARIVNGSPTGAGVLSDSARNELQHVVDGTLPPASLKRVINRLYVEFGVRQGAIANSAKAAGLDMSSLVPRPSPGPAPNAAPGAPPTPTGAPPAGGPTEGAKSVSKSGKPMIFSNGHWQYQ